MKIGPLSERFCCQAEPKKSRLTMSMMVRLFAAAAALVLLTTPVHGFSVVPTSHVRASDTRNGLVFDYQNTKDTAARRASSLVLMAVNGESEPKQEVSEAGCVLVY